MKAIIQPTLLVACCLVAAIVHGEEKPDGKTHSETPKKTQSAVVSAAISDDGKKSDAEAPVPVDAAKEDGRRPALTGEMLIKVINPDDAKAAVKAEAERLGGFLSYLDAGSIVLKIPPTHLAALMGFAKAQGYVIQKTLGREELSQEIAELTGRLKSKQEILTRLRGFFNDSDAVATLEIERTMTGVVLEIEQVKGRLRYLNDRADFARLHISFSFRERDRVVYVTSPFEWLNSADLDGFIGRFWEAE